MPVFEKLSNFERGWVFGDFSPSLVRSSEFEVCIASHKKCESSTPHYHTASVEYNLIISGEIEVSGRKCVSGDIFIYEKNEISNVRFIEDSTLVVVRIPSAPKDKVIVE